MRNDLCLRCDTQRCICIQNKKVNVHNREVPHTYITNAKTVYVPAPYGSIEATIIYGDKEKFWPSTGTTYWIKKTH